MQPSYPPRRRSARIRSALCLLLSLCVALPGAALASSVPTSVRVAMVTSPTTEMYPLQIMDRDLLSLTNLVYESLVVLDDSREPDYGLATDWKTTSDNRTWTFTLREGVRFHDGLELTAYDVAATMDAIKANAGDLERAPAAENGMYANTARVCKSWHAEDRYTLTVQTDRPSSLLYAMTFPVLQAQSLSMPNPPGTGPYRMELYTPGKELWLVGNQNWYGPTPYINEIIGVWYESDDAALRAFEAEDVDIVMTRSTNAVKYRGTSSSRINSYDYSTRQLECLLINSLKELTKTEMRQAIAHAINKTRLISGVYQNMVTTTNTIQSPASWLYNGDTATYRYDVEKANSLLDGIGWNNYNEDGFRIKPTEDGGTKTLEVRLCYYDEAGNSLRKEAAGEIANMLREVGFSVRLIGYSFEDAAGKLQKRDYDLFLMAYNFDIVPDPSFYLLSNGYGNFTGFRGDAADSINKLCQELRKSADQAQLALSWNQLQSIIAKEVPFIPLYWRNGVLLTRYAFSTVRDIREFELLKSINSFK